MVSNFKSAWFAANRRRLIELFTGTAPIVVPANGLLQRSADSAYPFEQDANFWYLTGLDDPDLVLVMDRGQEYLILPPRSAYQNTFDGEVIAKRLTAQSGIKKVYEAGQGWEQLANRLKKVKHAATLPVPQAYIDQYGLYTNPARAGLAEKLKAYNPGLELLDIGQPMTALRMIKQPEELAALQAAIDITTSTLKEAAADMASYAHEYEAEAYIGAGYRRLGSGHGFEPIVAGGPRATTLHYIANNSQLKPDELVLIDTGAQVEHYSADISRTYSLDKPTTRQKDVHMAVLQVQQFAISQLKPGVMLRDYEKQVEEYMGEQLKLLGLIKSVDQAAVRRYYPHATSHFLGLNVHDVGDYNRPLEPGMVLTVEPGIYIKEEGLGVRIEDDALVTKHGVKILSDELPRGLS